MYLIKEWLYFFNLWALFLYILLVCAQNLPRFFVYSMQKMRGAHWMSPQTVGKLRDKQISPQTATLPANLAADSHGELKSARCWLFACRIQKWATVFEKSVVWNHILLLKSQHPLPYGHKMYENGKNVGFLRRLSQNRQRRRPMPFRPHVVIKEQSYFLLQHFRVEPRLHERSKQPMLYFLEKAAMLTTFLL